jgi:hypothetical protein
MSQIALIRLVKSLSKSEKRHFRISTRKQSGSKEYLDLFDLIDRNRFLQSGLVVSEIEKDKYETQLLKYFDFTGWVKNKLEKQ